MSGVVRSDLRDALLARLTACADGVRFTTDNNAAATEAGFVRHGKIVEPTARCVVATRQGSTIRT